MNKKEEEEIHNLQGQWLFVVFGAILAVLFGVAVNALYEFLRAKWSAGGILLVFGFLALFFLDSFSYLFENLREIRDTPDLTTWATLRKYFRDRVRMFAFWK